MKISGHCIAVSAFFFCGLLTGAETPPVPAAAPAQIPAAPVAVQTQVPAAVPGRDASHAEENSGQRSGREGHGGFGRGFFEKISSTLKEKYPAEYAELEKLMQTDRRAAFAKIRELAEKEGLSFGPRGRGGHGEFNEWKKLFDELQQRFPEESAEIRKLLLTDREAALTKIKKLAAQAGLSVPESPLPEPRDAAFPAVSPRNRNRFMTAYAERIIKDRYPEDYEMMLELRKTDPDAARELFRDLVKEAGLTLERMEREAMGGRVRSVVFTDKELEAQYEQRNGTGSGNGGFGGGRFGGFGGGRFGGFGGGNPMGPPPWRR